MTVEQMAKVYETQCGMTPAAAREEAEYQAARLEFESDFPQEDDIDACAESLGYETHE